MLNTDLCLAYDVSGLLQEPPQPCCTWPGNGPQCPMYPFHHPYRPALDATQEMLGGGFDNGNNRPFYEAFKAAWEKATTAGHVNLRPLTDSCPEPLLQTPSPGPTQ